MANAITFPDSTAIRKSLENSGRLNSDEYVRTSAAQMTQAVTELAAQYFANKTMSCMEMKRLVWHMVGQIGLGSDKCFGITIQDPVTGFIPDATIGRMQSIVAQVLQQCAATI